MSRRDCPVCHSDLCHGARGGQCEDMLGAVDVGVEADFIMPKPKVKKGASARTVQEEKDDET